MKYFDGHNGRLMWYKIRITWNYVRCNCSRDDSNDYIINYKLIINQTPQGLLQTKLIKIDYKDHKHIQLH